MTDSDEYLEKLSFGGDLVVEPEVNEARVKRYNAAAEEFEINPDLVYHPAQHNDVSPSAAFPESEVIYVDVDEDAVEALQEEGYDARVGDAEKYELDEKADLAIFMNQMFDVENTVEHNLAEEGWVIANNYHGAASTLQQKENYVLNGAVSQTYANHPTAETREPEVETDNLELYWERITNEEEYKEWRPEKYRRKMEKVKKESREEKNLFEGLKDIKREKMQQKINELQTIGKDTHEERIKSLQAELGNPKIHKPTKKGNADTLYVFQRRNP